MGALADSGNLPSFIYAAYTAALLYTTWHLLWLLYRRLFWKLPPSYGLSLPFLGHLLHFRGVNDVPKALRDKCSALKSPLVYMRLAGFDTIVICDYKLAVEAFVTRDLDFSDRPHFPVLENIFFSTPFVRNATPIWKAQRKLFHESLRLYGSGSLLEEHSYDAVDKMLTVLQSEKGPFNPQLHLFLSVYHTITMICFNKSYSLDDGGFRHLVDLDKRLIKLINSGVLTDFIHPLQYFPLSLLDIKQRKAKNVGAEYYNLVKELFEERRSQFDEKNPTCLVDHILDYYEKLKSTETDEEERAAVNQLKLVDLVGLCFITYFAGVETTSYTINWFVYCMALYPEIQKKLRTHLVEVLGSRRPRLSDKSRLSYFRAVLFEVMRFVTTSPLGAPHRNSSVTTLAGYDVPANSMIVYNQWAINNNPVYWGSDVGSFKPERFLNEDGTLAPRPDGFLVFGCGRRACPGQSLALKELFLLLPPLFQHLEFRFPKGFVPPKVEDSCRDFVTRSPPPYKIEIHPV